MTKPLDEQLLLNTVGRVLAGAGKVLVVDDDRDTQSLLRQVLSNLGIDVRTTASGRRALELAQQDKFDLICSTSNCRGDGRLPGIDATQTNEQTAAIPVIVLTGSLTLKKSSDVKCWRWARIAS